MSSSEQDPLPPVQPNVAPDQIHLVLSPDELATIIVALRAIELYGFAERLNAVLRHVRP